jgi:hypothetical protein
MPTTCWPIWLSTPPLVSHDERAKAFLNRNQDFLGRFRGKAREILELLVDKYRV